MKNIYFIIGFITILLFIGMSNIKAIDVEGAINVDTLPTCDSTTKNNVYALSTDNHYHKCKEIGGGFRNIQVGDNLYNHTLYMDFPDDFYLSLLQLPQSQLSPFITFSLSNCFIRTSTFSEKSVQLFIKYGREYNIYFYRYISSVINNLSSYYVNDLLDKDIYQVTSIDVSNPAYQYIKISANTTYRYEDLGEITEHVHFVHVNKDFYLFYDFETISTFDIFNSYDFTTFNDFQRLVIVIGVNTFYLGFIGLCIYIVIKLIYKLCSWII